MRKFFSLMAALLVLLSLASPALAVDKANKNVFYESVAYKDAPTITKADTKDCLVVTSVGGAEQKKTDITQTARDELIRVYNELNDKTMDSPASKGYVIRELVDVSYKDEGCLKKPDHSHEEWLAEEGNTIDVTFKTGVAKNVKVEVFYYKDKDWHKAPAKNNGDRTVTVTFEDICPVAFCVKKGSDTSPPQTGDQAFPTIWIAVMLISLVVLAALIVLRKKFRK